jgi:hypothetical protein
MIIEYQCQLCGRKDEILTFTGPPKEPPTCKCRGDQHEPARMVRLFCAPRINVGHGSLGNPKRKDREPTWMEKGLRFGPGRRAESG